MHIFVFSPFIFKFDEKLFPSKYFSDDCALFNLNAPEFEICQKIEEDLKHHESMWSLFDEFNTGNINILCVL